MLISMKMAQPISSFSSPSLLYVGNYEKRAEKSLRVLREQKHEMLCPSGTKLLMHVSDKALVKRLTTGKNVKMHFLHTLA